MSIEATRWFSASHSASLRALQDQDKVNLAQASGLEVVQVNNWFINQRKRAWHKVCLLHTFVQGGISSMYGGSICISQDLWKSIWSHMLNVLMVDDSIDLF